jgi:ATP-dependent Clp protease ATP-binding subunit ClpA
MTDAYGTHYGYIEIAGSELEGEQSIHRFLGAPPGYVGHGQPTLLDPVRENPYHVIVINEIEKADEKILVGLMEAIDTGKLGMADNSRPIELNRCIMLFTSNLPIDMQKYESLNEFERAEMCRDAFTKFCGRPEISGKIGNFLAFSPLTEDAKTDVIIKFVREVLESYDMKLAHIDEYLMADFLKRQTKYGARGIRVFVENAVGRHILNANDIEEFTNKEVTLKGTTDNIEFEIA